MRTITMIVFMLLVGNQLAYTQSLETYLNTGIQHLQANRFQAAVENFNYVVQLDSKFIDGYLRRAYALTKLNQLEAAIQDYGKVIILDPNNTYAIGTRGALKIKIGRYREAVEDFNRAILIEPQDYWDYVMRGEAKYQAVQASAGDSHPFSYQEILNDYTQGINLNNRFSFAYNRRAMAFLDSLMSTERLFDTRNLNALCNDWSIAQNLGEPEATENLMKYCGQAMYNLIAKKTLKLARYQQTMNNYAQAIQYYDQIMQLNLSDASLIVQTLVQRSDCKLLSRDFEGAVQDFTNLLGLGQAEGYSIASTHYKRGWAYTQIRKWEEALSDFNRAIDLGYKTSWIYFQRGLTKEQLKDSEGACQDWTESSKKGNTEASKKVKAKCKSGLFNLRK